MIALTPRIMVLILWTLRKSHTTFNIITGDTAAKNKDLNTRNMPEDNFWNIFRWEAPLIKTNQPMLMWKVCRKGLPNRQLHQKTINQMKKKSIFFALQLHPQSEPKK